MSDTVIRALNKLREIEKLKPKLEKLAKKLSIAKKQAQKKRPRRAAK
jgi:hypothetical protein